MALSLARDTSPDDRHIAWVRVVKRIYDEQVQQGWRHQMFRLVRSVFIANQRLSDEGGFLFNWMAENYRDASLMLVRRELDVQSGTENLRNLLEDIIDHPDVMTRGRYLAQWEPREAAEAHTAFNSFNPIRVPGEFTADHIDPTGVRNDLDRIVADGDRVRKFAERTRAHRTPEQGIDRTITFGDLHRSIDDIRGVVGKYHALLTLSCVALWEPVAQYDTTAPFELRWVSDRAAVIRGAVRESTE